MDGRRWRGRDAYPRALQLRSGTGALGGFGAGLRWNGGQNLLAGHTANGLMFDAQTVAWLGA